MKPLFTVLDNDGNEVSLPCLYAVCDRCGGTGVHDHPAFSNGISQEQWNDEWDAEEREAYMRGRYDVPCSECRGLRVTAVPDETKLTPEQKEWLESHWRARAEARAEQRMRDRGIEF